MGSTLIRLSLSGAALRPPSASRLASSSPVNPPLFLAGILEGRMGGEGAPLSRGIRESGLSLEESYRHSSAPERQALRDRIPETFLTEFFSISQESDPELLFEGMLSLGTRLSQ